MPKSVTSQCRMQNAECKGCLFAFLHSCIPALLHSCIGALITSTGLSLGAVHRRSRLRLTEKGLCRCGPR
jgi:hypothetical protein